MARGSESEEEGTGSLGNLRGSFSGHKILGYYFTSVKKEKEKKYYLHICKAEEKINLYSAANLLHDLGQVISLSGALISRFISDEFDFMVCKSLNFPCRFLDLGALELPYRIRIGRASHLTTPFSLKVVRVSLSIGLPW